MAEPLNRWTHALCLSCWNRRHPDLPPAQEYNAPGCACCACRAFTFGGIYIRAAPEDMPCHGATGAHALNGDEHGQA